jgi:hypothetical protein
MLVAELRNTARATSWRHVEEEVAPDRCAPCWYSHCQHFQQLELLIDLNTAEDLIRNGIMIMMTLFTK